MLGNLSNSDNLTLIFLITAHVGNWALETILGNLLILKKYLNPGSRSLLYIKFPGEL